MAYPRSKKFSDEQLKLAEAARALGHPGRLALLEVLAGRTTCTCGELVSELPLAQATVSQHLKVLKEAGLIRGTIDGPRSCYYIDREAISSLGEAVDRWFEMLGESESCC
jgi:ArsR family transcriptional regulator